MLRMLWPFTATLIHDVYHEIARPFAERAVPVARLALTLEPGDEVAHNLRWAADVAESDGVPVRRAFDACAPLNVTELDVDPRTIPRRWLCAVRTEEAEVVLVSPEYAQLVRAAAVEAKLRELLRLREVEGEGLVLARRVRNQEAAQLHALD